MKKIEAKLRKILEDKDDMWADDVQNKAIKEILSLIAESNISFTKDLIGDTEQVEENMEIYDNLIRNELRKELLDKIQNINSIGN